MPTELRPLQFGLFSIAQERTEKSMSSLFCHPSREISFVQIIAKESKKRHSKRDDEHLGVSERPRPHRLSGEAPGRNFPDVG